MRHSRSASAAFPLIRGHDRIFGPHTLFPGFEVGSARESPRVITGSPFAFGRVSALNVRMRDTYRFKRILLLIATVAFVVVGCSSDGGSGEGGELGEGLQDVAEGVGEAVDDAGQAVEDAGQAVEDAATPEESDSLPTWAIVLIVAVVILGLVGVVLGLQNRNARKTQEATAQGYQQGKQDQ